MTLILSLGDDAVLGRLHSINRKHRLRTKHFAEVQWPESLSIDVIDASALDSQDHFPCLDQVFLVSEKLRDVIQGLAPEVEARPVQAGNKTVFLVMPYADSDVGFECSDGRSSTNGYQRLSATDLRVSETPSAHFCNVRNTGALAISEELSAAAAAAGVVWSPAEVISTFGPFREHPYAILGTGRASATVKKIIATSAWPDATSAGHPIGNNAVDESLRGTPDEAWAELVAETDDADKCATARFGSGLPIAQLRGELDAKVAKSKLKSRWKETAAAKTAYVASLPVVSQSIREIFEAAGVEAEYQPFSITDTELGVQRDDLWIVHPLKVMPWIDWSKSDVGLRWSGLMDEYFDLHPTEDSYLSSIPLVRVEGSTLLLVHKDLAERLTRADGFRMVPLGERAVSLNLDDCFKY